MGAAISSVAIGALFTVVSLLTITFNIGGINDDEE